MPRTGFAFPTGTAAAHVVEVARAAEAQGFESFWLTEGGGKDSISQLAYVAAHTDRIKLGTGIITIFSRTPVMIAQTTVGLNELSGGRFILGLGSGHEASVERGQGQRYVKPSTRMADYIRIIKSLLRDGHVSYQGEAVSVEDFRLIGAETPVEAPVYVATLGGPLARVAGALADGVLPLMAGPEGIRRLREHIAEGARAAGRDPAAVDVACFIIACASDDASAAEAEVSSSESEPELEPEPESKSPPPAVGEKASASVSDDRIEDRDSRLLPITNRALRGVKKAVTDAQNVALDTLRTDADWAPEAT
ncbi:MAG: LLM class flavin-dependent oxidoreductase, partial [Chloroflexi bacterium]|nr:LLM class flavin-dependent oxidoreductase [Chloroflexota bacterium]